MIKVEVHSTRAVIRSQEPLTVGLRGGKARFVFGPSWTNLIKAAVFRQGDKTVTVADIGEAVTIPHEVLALPGIPVQIGVYGIDDAGAVAIPTLWAETEPVRPGTDPEEGVPPTEPTAGLWEQLQGLIGSLEKMDTNDRSSLVGAINELRRRIPVCTSELFNDSGFLTRAPVTSVNGQIGAVTVDIPTKVSQLQNDSGFLTEAPVTSVNGQIGAVTVDIPTKVSQLQNDSGFLTEAPVTTTKVELTKQTDGSYLSDLSAAEIMAAYKAHKTVHCYHNKLILPLIHSVITGAVFSGIYDGQIQTVTVDFNKVATVTATPVSSGGGGADGITPHIGENGNWWLGEEDTGVSAGVTDEQVERAFEEYIQDNPVVKTVNGIAPDGNGNVALSIGAVGTSGSNVSRFSVTLEEAVSAVTLTLPANWESIIQFNIHINFPNSLTGDMSLQWKLGGEYRNVGTFNADTKGYNMYAIRFDSSNPYLPKFTYGTSASSASSDTAVPTFESNKIQATWNSNEFRWKSLTDGVVFPTGTIFDVWVVYAA